MKKFIYAVVPVLVIFLPFLLPSLAYATSGACSDHGGVDCSAGAGAYGQAICNDGWTGSSVSYDSMVECQSTQTPIATNNLFAMKQQCASYTNIIQNEIIDADISSQANAKIHPGNQITSVLGEVFYSPIANSCLYTETTVIKSTPITEGSTTLNISGTTFSINDYLDNDTQIYTAVLDPNESEVNSPKVIKFNEMVDYYKGNIPTQSLTSSTVVAPAVQTSESVNTTASAPAASASSPAASLSSYAQAYLKGTLATTSGSQNYQNAFAAAKQPTSTPPKSLGLFSRVYHFISSFFKFF